jgi:hypothetical protein
MKRGTAFAFIIALAIAARFPAFAASPTGTLSLIRAFFALSGNDFSVDSASTAKSERDAYDAIRGADVDADGVATYAEWLEYRNQREPGSVADFDFAVAPPLCASKDFSFVEKGDVSCQATLTRAIDLADGAAFPAGTRIDLKTWPGVSAFLPADAVVRGIPLKGGPDAHADLYMNGNQLILGSIRLSKDATISGVPCKAMTGADPWDMDAELARAGALRRATLAAPWTAGGLSLLAGEKVMLDDQGRPEAAYIARNRRILGKDAIAFGTSDRASAGKGFWGGGAYPNAYFSNGRFEWCFEKDKVVDGALLPGIRMYRYGGYGNIPTGLYDPDSDLLGYPLVPPSARSNGDWWTRPETMATLSGGTASFVLGAGVKASGKTGAVDLPEGAKVTIDLKSGCCLSVVYTDGRKAAWDAVKDHVRPAPVAGDARSAAIKARAEAWLAAHPAAPDGSNRDLRAAYAALRDRMARAVRDEAIARAESKCLDGLALYKSKGAGLAAGNVAVDFSGDGAIQGGELVPDSRLDPVSGALTIDGVFAFMVDRADSLPASRLKAMGEAMTAVPLDSAESDLGAFDALGSILSKSGIHPFAARKIYYLPDGTGQKMLARRIEAWPSGSPKVIVIEPPGRPDENPEIKVRFRGDAEGSASSIWIYGRDKLDESDARKDDPKYWSSKGLSQEYWTSIDRIEFFESGRMMALGGVPYAPMRMTSGTGCASAIISAHNIRWNEEGDIVAMYPGETVAPVRDQAPVFRLPGGIEVVSPRWICWWGNKEMADLCFVQVTLDGAHPLTATFKKGPHTFFKQTDPAKMSYQPYVKDFERDTKVTFAGGFYLTESGEITFYW